MNSFISRDFFPDNLLALITETRVADPEFAWRGAQARQQRPSIAPKGRLNLLAADHPARNVTRVGDDPLAMADRRDYLARVVRVLQSAEVDGVMATMDVLEDLFIVDGILRDLRGAPLLDGRVLIASLNRGGLAGSAWELDDPISAATPATCRAWRLDGAKTLLRMDDEDDRSLKTMLACAQAINQANALDLPMFLEPMPVRKGEKGYEVVRTAAALARLTGVASALGDSSRLLWLKLPYCEEFAVVARATTLPILLLGGESAGDPSTFLRQLQSAMEAGSNVRGALVGRNVLYPGNEDPLAMANAAGQVVHRGLSTEQAMTGMAGTRGSQMHLLQKLAGGEA